MAATATAVLLAALLPLTTQTAVAAHPPVRTCDKQANNSFQKLLASPPRV